MLRKREFNKKAEGLMAQLSESKLNKKNQTKILAA